MKTKYFELNGSTHSQILARQQFIIEYDFKLLEFFPVQIGPSFQVIYELLWFFPTFIYGDTWINI